MSSLNESGLTDRTERFELRVMKLVDALPNTRAGREDIAAGVDRAASWAACDIRPAWTPWGALSIDAGKNPVRHRCLVLCPLLGAVFFGTVPVVITLTEGEQGDDEDKVGPGPGTAEVTKHQGDSQGKEPLAHVVEVAGDAP